MSLTGGEMVAEYLIAEDVPYVFGIPGHGDMAAFDAFKDRDDRITVIAPKHEQAAAHMADAYYRACGRPLATLTSIGPGSMNVATGLATAFVDSIPLISFTGGPQTYMLGRGVLQELERQQDNVFPHILQPMVKRNWDVQHVDLLADVLPRAFNTALSGRPGPVHIELPMDVQAERTDLPVPDPALRRPARGRPRPDADAVDAAAAKLLAAERPVILAGGGCLTAEAAAELRAVAEFLDAPVVVTMMGKGVFPEDHPLSAEHTGSNGTAVGNHMTREADVLLAVGTRFAEQTSSSYVQGQSFSVPGTEIIHFDIDPTEIGKNYETVVGAVCDARTGLSELLAALQDRGGARGRRPARVPRRAGRAQAAVARPAQGALDGQALDEPGAARGARRDAARDDRDRLRGPPADPGVPGVPLLRATHVAQPGRLLDDGLHAARGDRREARAARSPGRRDSPATATSSRRSRSSPSRPRPGAAVIIACLNNTGWLSIRDFQRGMFGEDRAFSVEFRKRKGDQLMPVDFVAIAKAFNCGAEKVETADEVAGAVGRALASDGPYLIEFKLSREPEDTEGINVGHWDLPKPAYLPD